MRAFLGFFIIKAVLLCLPFCVQAQTPLSADQAVQDTRVLKTTLATLHPGLTKYQTSAQMDAAFARFEARGNAARSATEMYLAAAQLTAAIRCGHTWASTYNMTPALRATLMDAANKVPFWMVSVENRWLVVASADNTVQIGDEIISLNGVPAAEISAKMLPYQRADGMSSDAKRILQLHHGRNAPSMMDIMWPLLFAPQNSRYNVQLKRGGAVLDVQLAATTIAIRDAAIAAKGVKLPSAAWTFKIENNIGVLTLPTFSFWNSKFDWSKFLVDTFAELNAKNIPHLVIDIRANEGGNGAINNALLSYLLRTPYSPPAIRSVSAYERAPYQLAKHLDTWNYGFFDRTSQVEKTADNPPRFIIKSTQGNDAAIKPSASAYNGKTTVLISAENSSATFQLAEILKQTGAATLIGQATTGNKRGLNSGQIAWVTLPNSGVAVDIPLLSAEPVEAQPDAGVMPDAAVPQTFAARVAGQDLEMAAALKLIASRK